MRRMNQGHSRSKLSHVQMTRMNIILSDDEDNCSTEDLAPEEILLQAARSGKSHIVKDLLTNASAGSTVLDINCKGTQKANLGWTPLHLACYFGHFDVADLLLSHGANVDVDNPEGDTPLHKAAYTGREGLVLLLLKHGADVFIINCEGQSPKGMAKDLSIVNILAAAEVADGKKKAEQFFAAAKVGSVEAVQELLRGRHPLSINSVDGFGNTALHCAAYRDQKEVAIFLLQCGIDSSLCNARGQIAADLARTDEMRQVLHVAPVRQLRKNATRHEGPLLRRKRILGPRLVWAVLDRGVLSFFRSRADAASGTKRKRFHYLDGARVECNPIDEASFTLFPSDSPLERLAVPPVESEKVDRMKWVTKLKEHIEFSSYYTHHGMSASDSEEEDIMMLGSMQDVLTNAQAHQQLLERGVERTSALHAEFMKVLDGEGGSIRWLSSCQDLVSQFRELLLMSRTVSQALGGCMVLFKQQEEVRTLRLQQEQERSRVLQEAVSVLARENHDLECTLSSPIYGTGSPGSGDQFYDAFDDSDVVPSRAGTPNSTSGEDVRGSSTSLSTPRGTESVRRQDAAETATQTDGGDDDDDDPTGELYVSLTSSAESKESPSLDDERSFWGRSHLPVPMFSKNDFSLWSILKQCIGKELSKITMPVVFNEPLSFLQRISENMEYSYLLEEADKAKDPADRMELVTAYAVSALASNLERLSKPFNPLLGETYELVRDDIGFRIVCEQVSHHPPMSAFHADSPHFKLHGSVYPKLKFWGKSIEIKPEGHLTLTLLSHGETYTWTNVNCCIHNIIVGKLWFEQYGVMEIVCQKSGMTSALTFKQAGWFYKDLHRIEGFIYNRQKAKLRFLYGKWTDYLKSVGVKDYEEYMQTHAHTFRAPDHPGASSDLGRGYPGSAGASPAHTPKKMYAKLNSFTRSLTGGSSGEPPKSPEPVDLDNGEIPKSDSTYSLDIPNSHLLWRAAPRPDYASDYYNFTLFAMALNEMEDGMTNYLPSTDCRLRPDMRKLEAGDLDGAASEKNRLEEKQREARKYRKKRKETWEPKWFKLSKPPHSNTEEWLFTGEYWNRDYSTCPDIF